MSYSIHLIGAEPCPTCGHMPDCDDRLPDPTYNLTPIFDLALTGEQLPNPAVNEAHIVLFKTSTDRPRGLRVLSGRKAGETVEQLEGAVTRLSDPAQRSAFLALEPSNGWGDLPGAQEVIERLLEAAKMYPKLTWEIN